MKCALRIAVITSSSVMFAWAATAAVAPVEPAKPRTVVFAQDSCNDGYEWNETQQRCVKTERDY